jgi:hypothetical protein
MCSHDCEINEEDDREISKDMMRRIKSGEDLGNESAEEKRRNQDCVVLSSRVTRFWTRPNQGHLGPWHGAWGIFIGGPKFHYEPLAMPTEQSSSCTKERHRKETFHF